MVTSGASNELVARFAYLPVYLLKRGRSVLNRHGYDIHPVDSRCWEDQRALLGNHKETLIFDVRANCGQTAWQYRNLFPYAQIYSFDDAVFVSPQLQESSVERLRTSWIS